MAKGIGALDNLPTTLYRVYDTVLDEYWVSEKGKSVWHGSGHAKNAWNCGESKNADGQGTIRNYNIGRFTEQTRFTVHQFKSKGWELSGVQLPLDLDHKIT